MGASVAEGVPGEWRRRESPMPKGFGEVVPVIWHELVLLLATLPNSAATATNNNNHTHLLQVGMRPSMFLAAQVRGALRWRSRGCFGQHSLRQPNFLCRAASQHRQSRMLPK